MSPTVSSHLLSTSVTKSLSTVFTSPSPSASSPSLLSLITQASSAKSTTEESTSSAFSGLHTGGYPDTTSSSTLSSAYKPIAYTGTLTSRSTKRFSTDETVTNTMQSIPRTTTSNISGSLPDNHLLTTSSIITTIQDTSNYSNSPAADTTKQSTVSNSKKLSTTYITSPKMTSTTATMTSHTTTDSTSHSAGTSWKKESQPSSTLLSTALSSDKTTVLRTVTFSHNDTVCTKLAPPCTFIAYCHYTVSTASKLNPVQEKYY
ncbi:hypothetical protein SK128_009401 [Halocaridina rubra]|uniref:Uncharacterized protein n=1 Tax=Halocaridina rubra TaxID=373956 RepID=A0AAN8WQ49_HALRR